MAEFVLSAVLTNAGIAARDAALTGTKLDITSVVFGNARVAVSAATTNIGTVVANGGAVSFGFSLLGDRTDVFFFFDRLPDKLGGTIGIYSGAVLLAVCRYTPSATDLVDHVTCRIVGLTRDSFPALAKTIIPASMVGDAFVQSHERKAQYQQRGIKPEIASLGSKTGANISTYLLSQELPILGTASEVSSHQLAVGGTYYDLRDWKQYANSGGTYAATGVSLVVNKGRFYFSTLNNSLYYAREDTDLIFLSKFNN